MKRRSSSLHSWVIGKAEPIDNIDDINDMGNDTEA